MSLSGGLRAASYQLVPLTKLLLNQQQAVLICDGVGVGKTISAAFALIYLSESTGRPGLVVCPPSLQEKWRGELRSKFQAMVIPVRNADELATATDEWESAVEGPQRIYVMPSSLLTRATPLRFLGPVVIDEVHHYRNPETRLWSSAKALVDSASHRIGLSATPINNTITDLAAELSLLLKLDQYVTSALVSDLWRPEYRSLLYAVLTRFSKERLGIHFTMRVIRDVRVSFPEAYSHEVLNAIKTLRGRPATESVFRDEITYLRLAASSPRAFHASIRVATSDPQEKKEALHRILEQHQEDQILVFCEFEETARELADSIASRRAFVMTGSVPVFEREVILERFRLSVNGVLVMTSIGSEGLDLQFCHTLVNFDLTWNPMILEQRIGRIDRIGQEKRAVFIYNVIVDGSIDERVIRVLGAKLGVLSGTILEPASILSNGNRSQLFWDEETLAEEVSQAEALAKSLELAKGIIPDDYEVLEGIDLEYCSGNRLREAARSDSDIRWLSDAECSKHWSARVIATGDKLRRKISQYT